MTICKNLAEPGNNDAYTKDGNSALCPKHKEYLGFGEAYKELAFPPEWFSFLYKEFLPYNIY